LHDRLHADRRRAADESDSPSLSPRGSSRAAAADDADRTADELVAVRAVDPFFDDGSRGLRDAARAAAAVRAAALAAGDGGGDGADHRADRRDDAGAGDRAAAFALAVLVVADRGGRAAEDRELPRRTARDVAAGENLA